MNEFLKLTWGLDDAQLSPCFLPEDVVSQSYVYKSFDKSLKAKIKRNVKLNLDKERFVPGKKYFRIIKRRSLLNKWERNECLAAMKLIQTGYVPDNLTAKQKCNLKVYNECHSKIAEENRLFLEHIQSIWNKNSDKIWKCRPGIYNYAWPHWKDKLDRYLYYPEFYKEVSSLCLNFDENEATIDFRQALNPLEMGVLARFNHPMFKEPCYLRLSNFQSIDEDFDLNSKLPVSQDENIIKLAEKFDFDVTISSSALKQLIDYTDTKTKWIIPVVIKEITVDNKVKKIVFIDKVLPKTNPSFHDLNCFAYKRLLKMQFCQYEAFKFPVEEAVIHEPKASDNTDEVELARQHNETNTKKKSEDKKIIHHNVSYRIWNVKKIDTQNTLMKNKNQNKKINLLVRSKLEACEGADEGVLFPVIVRPKIEQQLQYGVNICSKSELARDWASLFFRIYSNLYRARIYSPVSEIITVEKCSIHKINAEAQTYYNYKPILGLGVLQKVMTELMGLDCGNYLLQHLPKHESFVTIMKECDPSTTNFYNLHAECEGAGVDVKCKQNWLPINVNYILPVHEEHGQIPGIFSGFHNRKFNKQNLKATGMANKKKKKKKKAKLL